jgi:8-oxo-dGTP pyrophosphatase MutT (NUDIX family)
VPSPTLPEIASALARHASHKRSSGAVRASVAVVLREAGGGVELLLVERAERAGDRWSGHLAFPGGVMARDDRDLLATALRETREEAGLDLGLQARPLGELSDRVTLAHGALATMVVTPFVFELLEPTELELGRELRSSIWLRFDALWRERRALGALRKRLGWIAASAGHPVGPAMLWGLTLMMLDELVELAG